MPRSNDTFDDTAKIKEREQFKLLEELDRLEELLEDMTELGITSLEDLQNRIAELELMIEE